MASSEGEESQQPQLVLADKLFLLKQPNVQDIDKVGFKEDVFTFVKDHDMVPLYETLVADSVLDMDRTLLDSMRAKIDDELKKLDEKIADAEENLGESEVREAHLAKSLFFIRIGDKEKALEHLKITETKTVAVGQKMDLVFYTLQLGFFDMDFDLISKSIDKAKSFFGFAARKAVSATAFTVTGVVNKFLTVAINVTIWDKHASPAGLEDFEEHAAKVKTLKESPSNENLLILYGLYKQATLGPVTTARPGIFSQKDRAKWDAWKAVEGKSKDEAMSDYITKVKQLLEEAGLSA